LDEYGQIALLEHVYKKLRKDLLIVSYESLLGNANKVDILQNMLEFSNYGHEDKQRVECAYAFIDTRYYSAKIAKIMTFYRGLERKLLCEIMYYSKVYHEIILFKFRNLVEDVDCTEFRNDFS
jgi:hypothetical protein